jgi:hypothetical protein
VAVAVGQSFQPHSEQKLDSRLARLWACSTDPLQLDRASDMRWALKMCSVPSALTSGVPSEILSDDLWASR